MPVDVKRMIAETFEELIKHRSIDKITVKDLVESCKISRQTFYYHFQDILDVIEWAMQQEMQRMLEASLKAKSPEEAMSVFASIPEENCLMIRRLLDSRRRDQIGRIMTDTLRTYLQEMFHTKVPQLEKNLSRGEWDVMLDFYAYGMAGVLLKNCVQDHMPPDILAHYICRLFPERLLESKS